MKTPKTYKPQDDILTNQLIVFIILIGCAVALAFIVGELAILFNPDIATQPPIFADNRAEMPYPLAPERTERIIFLSLAALIPPGLVAAFLVAGRKPFDSFGASNNPAIQHLLILLAASIVTYPLISSDLLGVFFYQTAPLASIKWLLYCIAAVISVLVVIDSLVRKQSKIVPMWLTLLFAIAAVVVLQTLPYRFVNEKSVTVFAYWSISFDAAIYALTQVVHGKTILAGLPSQYGFFPELVAPIFKMVGLTVLSISAFFALLQVSALTAIAALLKTYIKSGPLSILTFLTILIPTSLFFLLNGHSQEIYLQYFPIRFFWPAVALLLFSMYSAKPTRLRLIVLGIISGISIFWNIDSGVPVLISIGATLFVRPLLTQRFKLMSVVPALLFGVIGLVTFLALFAGLRLKAGVPLNIEEALASQKLFYGLGFNMIPMPLPIHPWQSVLAIYAAGAVAAIFGWRRRSADPIYDVLFCASILGLGLFTYYQGRSHINCLMLVLWPALVIGAFLADLILRSVRQRATSAASVLLAFPFVLFVAMGTVTMAYTSRDLISASIKTVTHFNEWKDPIVASELSFMRSTQNGRQCLILSQRQAIYYAELNSSSPLPGPGLIETLLQSDLYNLRNGALSDRIQCIYLGVGAMSESFVDMKDAALIARYPVASKNELGTMLLLEPPKPSLAD